MQSAIASAQTRPLEIETAEAQRLYELGMSHYQQWENAQAIEYWQKALKIFQANDDKMQDISTFNDRRVSKFQKFYKFAEI